MEKKKNYNLLKVLCIPVLLYLVLTWIIPTGSFSGSGFVDGEVTPLGLYGLFMSPVYSFAVFAQYIILILCIGGFYGILNKTGAYQRIVEFFAGKNKTKFLIATVCIFAVLTSVFGEMMLVFILLPFFVSVLLKLGYDKVSSVAATVGSALIGASASISGNMAIYKNYFNLDAKIFVLFNIILLIIFIFLLCMLIISKNISKDSKKKIEAVKDIPLYENVKDKKGVIPLVVILIILLLFIILGNYNWYYSFGIDIFTNLHEKITSIELFGINIFSKVFGNFSEIGYFSNYDLSAILLIFSVLIAWVYSVKFNEFIDGFKKGVKGMLLPGVYVILASIVFSQVVTSGSGNISLTISNFILKLSNDFNVFTGSLTGILGSLFYNDYLYFLNGIYVVVSLYNTDMMPFILNVFQSMFGVMMLVLPVSMVLIGGLKYLDVSYKDWIKYMWKFLIQIFIISIIANIILSMIV